MNIFTIITTLLSLILTVISIAISIASYKQPFSTSPQTIFQFSFINIPYTVSDNSDAESDNQIFKNNFLYYTILSISILIFILWLFYAWEYINIASDVTSSHSVFSDKLPQAIIFSIFFTLKCIIWIIPILCIGLTAKYIKNRHSFYRIFHIISYISTALSCFACAITLLLLEYNLFIPTVQIDFPTAKELLQNISCLFLFFLIMLVIFSIYLFTKTSIWGETKSRYIRQNFQHIIIRITIPLLFTLLSFILYYIS